MNNTNKAIFAGLLTFAAIATSTSAMTFLPQASHSQSVASSSAGGGAAATAGGSTSEVEVSSSDSFANVKIVQDTDTIVITIGKADTPIPEGPIIIIPPDPEVPGDNGTIITPPAGNETGNSTVIGGNGTIIETPGNVTITDDNQTVIITDENNTITEIPENITVITPPPAEPCGCPPPANVTEPGPPVDVIVTPAPGQNVSVEEPQVPSEGNATVIEPGQPPAGNATVPPAANATEPAAPPAGNETAPPAPAANATEPAEGNATATEPPITEVPAGNETAGGGADNETVVILPPTEEPDVNVTGNVTVTPDEEPPQAQQLPAAEIVPAQTSEHPLFWLGYDQ